MDIILMSLLTSKAPITPMYVFLLLIMLLVSLSLHPEKIPENLFSGSLERDQCHEMSWVFNGPCNAYCQQNGQTQVKYVVACAAEFLKYLWPFYGNYSSSQNSLRLIYGTE